MTKMKLLIAILALATVRNSYCTLAMVLGTHQKITVIADSRRHFNKGGPDDHYEDNACKMIAIDNKLLFFAVNVTSGEDWNAQDEARIAWKAAPPGADLIWISKKWAQQVAAGFKRDFAHHPSSETPQGVLIMGIFALRSPTQIAAQSLVLRVDQSGRFSYVGGLPQLNGTTISPYGDAEIAEEFGDAYFDNHSLMPQFSQRSLEWVQSIKPKLALLPPNRRDVALLEELEKQTIALDSNGIAVHSPFDIATMTVSTGVNWIKRKANCPAN